MEPRRGVIAPELERRIGQETWVLAVELPQTLRSLPTRLKGEAMEPRRDTVLDARLRGTAAFDRSSAPAAESIGVRTLDVTGRQ
jgi:hypothetical protein